MEVKCGGGPAIKVKDRSVICHPEVETLEESAKRNNIPYQLEILEAGGSDPGSIHLTAGGIPSGAISIPVRYVHSPVETASMSDINNAVKLLVEAIADIYMYEINRLIKRFIKGFLPLWREAFLVNQIF